VYIIFEEFNGPEPIIPLYYSYRDDVFQDMGQVLSLCVALITCASDPKPPLLIPKCHFRASNRGLSKLINTVIHAVRERERERERERD